MLNCTLLVSGSWSLSLSVRVMRDGTKAASHTHSEHSHQLSSIFSALGNAVPLFENSVVSRPIGLSETDNGTNFFFCLPDMSCRPITHDTVIQQCCMRGLLATHQGQRVNHCSMVTQLRALDAIEMRGNIAYTYEILRYSPLVYLDYSLIYNIGLKQWRWRKKISTDQSRRSFYRAANAIFGRVGRIASEEVVFSEREREYVIARPSVCLSVCLSVVCL